MITIPVNKPFPIGVIDGGVGMLIIRHESNSRKVS